MTFRLKIELGNAAMLTGQDVAGALREVADKVEAIGDDELGNTDPYDRKGKIRDINGNTVGEWRAR